MFYFSKKLRPAKQSWVLSSSNKYGTFQELMWKSFKSLVWGLVVLLNDWRSNITKTIGSYHRSVSVTISINSKQRGALIKLLILSLSNIALLLFLEDFPLTSLPLSYHIFSTTEEYKKAYWPPTAPWRKKLLPNSCSQYYTFLRKMDILRQSYKNIYSISISNNSFGR